MDLKKEITEMIYKNSQDTSEGVLIDFKLITPLIENIVAITVTHCCESDSELLTSFAGYLKERDLLNVRKENIDIRVGLYLKRG